MPLNDYKFTVAERFMRYVQVDTQSDPHSPKFPTTEKQKDLSRILVNELLGMGVKNAHLDEHGYVYATVPSNSENEIPVICFCAHVDTSPDCSGTGVKPILHRKYDGSDIVLPDDQTQIITTRAHPYLLEKMGDDIITASGNTLLGADDKSGVAIIMDAVNYWMHHEETPHGTIKILFTPDEEVGRGVEKLDLQKLGAQYAYTLDGGELGSLEDETFSADAVVITIHGISAHPGFGKDKLVNAIKIASAFLELLPKNGLSPETTDDKQGFVHPVHIDGNAEKVTIQFIIRDFETKKLEEYEAFLKQQLDIALKQFPGSKVDFAVKEQYRNMKEILDEHPKVTAYAEEAIKESGLTVRKMSVRGGTDGSRLSFMGLPCPNLFTGEMAFHSKHEYVSVQDMEKAVESVVRLAMIWEAGA